MHMFTKARVMTVISAALGAAIWLALGWPLPLLLGPMVGCLVVALAGLKLQDMGVLGTFMRTFLGVAIGSSVTPHMVQQLPRYGPSLLLIPVFVAVIGVVSYPFLRRVFGFDHPTAFYSAMPGGLQDMLIFGQEAGGNVRTMSLIHATRVLVIVTVAPFVLTMTYGLDLTAPPGAAATSLPLDQLALMLLAAVAGWQIATRVGLFGASILGPMIFTAVLSLSGILHTRPPAEVIWAAQFFIGIAVGANYSGITGAELRRDVGAGLIFSVLLAIISLGFIALVLHLSSASELEIILAFLPGGQAEMAIIALVAGADVALVVAHHLLRILVVVLLGPVFARWLGQDR